MADINEYTIASWMQGKVALTIGQETINSICFDRGVEPSMVCADTLQKERDLCLADLYMYCAALPTATATIDDKNGNWEHKEGSATVSTTDKKHYRLLAARLYGRWGEAPASMSSIRFGSRGIGMRRKRKM